MPQPPLLKRLCWSLRDDDRALPDMQLNSVCPDAKVLAKGKHATQPVYGGRHIGIEEDRDDSRFRHRAIA